MKTILRLAALPGLLLGTALHRRSGAELPLALSPAALGEALWGWGGAGGGEGGQHDKERD